MEIQQVYLPSDVLDALPSFVRHELSHMPPRRQAQFLEEFDRKARSVSLAYILWFFFGLHYAYQGKWGMQILFWCSWLVLLGFFWWVADAFRLKGNINDYNKDVATEVLRNMRATEGA